MANGANDIVTQLLSHVRLPRLRTSPGAPPGTLLDVPEAPPAKIRLLAYDPEKHVEADLDDLEDVSGYLEKYDVVWLDIEGLGDADLLEDVGELFEFPLLALEDVQYVGHRPKVEFFDERVQLLLKMPHWRETLDIEQVSVFAGPNFVVTFQLADRPADYFEPIRRRIVSGRQVIRNNGAAYLAYAIVDRIIDAGFPVLDHFAEVYHALESEVMEPATRDLLMRIHAMNGQLLVLRRALWPHREIIQQLQRHPESIFDDDVAPYLTDCLDHTVQIAELAEYYHALGSQILDFHLALAGHRQNEITKVLTIIATIFIPLTFIAGVYGMNFNPEKSPWNMPELNWAYGYPLTLLVMFAIGVALVIYFWRKGWIGRE